MKNSYRYGTGGLIAIGMSVGCASGAAPPAEPQPVPVEKVEQSIQQSFDRLNALEIVSAARLVLDLPAEATACYNLPCPGSVWEEKYHAERARQAPRLERLVGLAETAAHAEYTAMRDMSEADAAIQALNGLAVIEVAGLVEVKPANNPQCYNLPCGTDIAAADRVNSAHVTAVFATVDAAQKSGL
jgi:hypothetical protein